MLGGWEIGACRKRVGCERAGPCAPRIDGWASGLQPMPEVPTSAKGKVGIASPRAWITAQRASGNWRGCICSGRCSGLHRACDTGYTRVFVGHGIWTCSLSTQGPFGPFLARSLLTEFLPCWRPGRSELGGSCRRPAVEGRELSPGTDSSA